MVIVIDDEEIICCYLADILETLGWNVQTYSDPSQALSTYREDESREGVDFMIVDIRLGHIDSVTLVRQLQTHIGAVPVIFISGYPADDDLMNRLQSMECPTIFVKKPFTLGEISDAIASVRQLLAV